MARRSFSLSILLMVPAFLLLASCGQGRADNMRVEPPCTGVGPASQSLPGARSFIYRRASGRDLRVHVFSPPEEGRAPHPAVLMFFGGSWRIGDVAALVPQARVFARHGYVTVLADYRVACRDGTTPFASVDDARAAYRWLREHAGQWDIDRDRMILSGGSAGGQLALMTALRAGEEDRPAALVLFNPAVDLVQQAPWYQKPFAWFLSPTEFSPRMLPPSVIFHGRSDRIVPFDTVRRFCTRARAAGRTCVLYGYTGRNHGFYHETAIDPVTGRAPFTDTMGKALWFLDRQGLASADRGQ